MGKSAQEQQATWIWYPGDFEIRLNEKMAVKRTARKGAYPSYWRLDRHYSNIEFRFTYDLPHEEQIKIAAEGIFALYLDGKDNYRNNQSLITLPAGQHKISVSVFNDVEIPALFIESDNLCTDSSWEVRSYQNDWVKAGSWTFNSPDQPPSQFRLALTPQEPISSETRDGLPLLDFGKETFGYLRFHGLSGKGKLSISYGESIAEALSPDECVLIDEFDVTEMILKRRRRQLYG